MTTVTVKNLSQGLRAFQNLDKQHITLKPGDSRTFEMPAHHVMLLEREQQKPTATIQVSMSSDTREEYDAELKAIRTGNKEARMKSRQVMPARAVPNAPRQPPVDRRFLTDPQTVHPERTADPMRKDQGGPGDEVPKKQAEPKDKPKSAKAKKQARVALKQK